LPAKPGEALIDWNSYERRGDDAPRIRLPVLANIARPVFCEGNAIGFKAKDGPVWRTGSMDLHVDAVYQSAQVGNAGMIPSRG
jgi:hypothetical protein